VVGRWSDVGGSTPDLQLERVKIATVNRAALHVASGASFEVAVPSATSVVAFAIVARKPDGDAAAARFVIDAEDRGEWKTVFDETLVDMRVLWHERVLSLASSPAPHARRLRFRATESGDSPAGVAELYWSNPAFLNRRGKIASMFSGLASRGRPLAPNVILISLDTLAAGHLSAFGGARGVSPHIDELLAKSFSFTRAYAQYPNTLTSHASMFTALRPKHHGVYGPTPYLHSQTLAAVLGGHGYLTNAVTEDGYIAAGFDFDRGFDAYDDGESADIEEITGNAARTFPTAMSWLDALARDARFFLFVHTYEVHTPYEIPDYEAKRTVARLDPGYRGRFADGYPGGEIEMDHNSGKATLTAPELKHLAALYAGEIHYLDEIVGRSIRHLESLPLARRTLVVLTADHGDEFGAHGKLGHGETLYEGAMHVPLAFYWPGVIQPGSSDAPVQLVDVMPTILDLVGVPIPAGLDGRSLSPVMRGIASERPAYAEIRYVPFAQQRVQNDDCLRFGLTKDCEVNLRAVWTRRFKLVASKQTGFEALFDLANDRGERRDVRAEFPDELARHWALLDEYDAAHAVSPEAGPSVDAATEERLRALGYVK